MEKEKFEKFINAMNEGINKEYLKTPMFEHLVENSEYLNNPDNINPMIIYPFKKCVALAIERTHKIEANIVNRWMNFSFLERNISQLCSDLYGSPCSVDRGRFIVKSYIKFKETKVVPKLDWKQKYTYHYPPSGKLEDWFALVEGLDELRYGYNTKYFIGMSNIMRLKK